MSTSTDAPPARHRPAGSASAGRRIARVAATLAVTVSAALGLAAPAQAAALGVLDVRDFRIEKVGDGNCRVIVNSFFPTASQAAAQVHLNSRGPISVRIMGDDPVIDNYQGVDPGFQLFTTPQGEVFIHSLQVVRCSRLNEDVSVFDNRDELYAEVRYARLGTDQTKKSRVVHGYF
ncbi:MAG: hypothetical protein L0H84_22565 [Pseudonocardia sp.]|nr:hypothetical protein [Pseudonocardia sp.]